jgi:hypothetical protein
LLVVVVEVAFLIIGLVVPEVPVDFVQELYQFHCRVIQ